MKLAITGLGVVTPLGNTVTEFWDSLSEGKSGAQFIDQFPVDLLRTDIASPVRAFDKKGVDGKDANLHGKVTLMLAAAAEDAIAQANLPRHGSEGESIGVLLGTGQGPVDVIWSTAMTSLSSELGARSVSPFFVPTAMPNAASALVSMRNGYRGPSFTVASACATGCHALAMSALMLRAGDATAMVAGGGEGAITPACVGAFGNARALARSFVGADGKSDPTRASRPYDAKRSGFVIGEGAGVLVLESEERARARRAPILAYLAGYGMSSDAEHIAKPHNEGRGIELAVLRALASAGLSPSDIDYWNPHATSTIHGDIAEYVGVRAVFGDSIKRLPVSATKSSIGHLLGGAGAVETIACVCTLLSQRIHPSLNVDQLDAAFDFDLVTGAARRAPVRHVLKTSAGFGGHNVALIISAAS